MREEIKRDKAVFERQVSDDFKKLVKSGISVNEKALRKLAKT